MYIHTHVYTHILNMSGGGQGQAGDDVLHRRHPLCY